MSAATSAAAPDIGSQVHATAHAALDFLAADPRRGKLLLGSHTSDVLQRARVESTRAISKVMSTAIREQLGDAAASELDTELAAFALVSGAMEAIAGWLRGDFDTSREHFADLVGRLLLAAADISTSLSHPGNAPAR